MIHLFKKSVKTLVLMLVMLIGISHTVLALDEIDQQKEVSLSIHYEHEDMPVKDVLFHIYYVAEVEADDEYVLTEVFENYPIELEDMDSADWRALAQTLTYYVQADDVAPLDWGVTDEQGIVKFPNQISSMKPGLYLVNAQPKVEEEYTYFTEPFLISLPAADEETDERYYDYSVLVKNSREENVVPPVTETVERKVLKIWEGDVEEVRPDDVTVELLKNGTLYDTVTLQAENNWRYTWEELPQYDEQGIKIEWGIVERNVEDYTASVSLEGTTFVLTNTYVHPIAPTPTPEPSPVLPQTGVLWWPVPVCAALGLLFLILGSVWKGRKDNE